jgi:transcriptional regulator with XRE-family HTH domain
MKWSFGHYSDHSEGARAMVKERIYSSYTREAAVLLGKQIRLGRIQRKWTEHELAERAGLSRATLQKIEKGDPSVAIGRVFEVASLVGVRLFDEQSPRLASHIARTEDKLALLPSTVRKPGKAPVDDDF